MKTFCILGAGTYGSYVAHLLSEKYKDASILLIEVGDEKIKNEEEIGFYSSNTNEAYNGAKKGRYFGLGGTSSMWGGQLLFFSDLDFPDNKQMSELVTINNQFKQKVLRRFFTDIPELKELSISKDVFIKKGIWLKFNQRNIFKYFKVDKKTNVKIIKNARAINLQREGNVIKQVTILLDNKTVDIKADFFYITCGAFESIRLLHSSGIIDLKQSSASFSDHISLRCFKILKSKPQIENTDFTFRIHKKSLITTRVVGQLEGTSFYMHPIYNEEFVFFQFLKNLIFKRKFSFRSFLQTGKQFFHLFPFALNYFVSKKLYVYYPWSLNIDIELDNNDNYIEESDNNDNYGQKGINIHYKIPAKTIDKLIKAKSLMRQLLIKNNIDFEDVVADASAIKLEDIYHPYNLQKHSNFKDAYNPLDNLFVFHTGILQRSGGINPTAAIFCVIEKHVEQDTFIES